MYLLNIIEGKKCYANCYMKRKCSIQELKIGQVSVLLRFNEPKSCFPG